MLRELFEPEEFLLVAYQPTDAPLFSAETFAALRELRAELAALERVRSVRSILDVPLPNAGAVALAEGHGMRSVFETARMYTGAAPALQLERMFGITSFELG